MIVGLVIGLVLGAAAAYIGIKPKALLAEVKGKSLAPVATAHGKTAAGLKAALLAPFHSTHRSSGCASRSTPTRTSTSRGWRTGRSAP